MKKVTLSVLISAVCFLPVLAQEDGATLYQSNCAQCHGTKLQGGKAQSLVDGIWQFGSGSSHIRRNIKHGITHMGMPAFEAALTDDQIRTLVDYLKASEKEAGAKPPPIPAFLQTQDYAEVDVQVVANGLEVPWAIDFLDVKTALVTERPGRLRVIKAGKLQKDPVFGTPEVLNAGQGGLLDVAVDPDYSKNGWVYLAYSHVLESPGAERPPAMTRLVRGKIRNNAWVDEQVIYEAPRSTYRTTRHHYGCRIVFTPDGMLYFSIGDRGASRQAQELDRPNGKIHRIHRDGSIPKDNPFVGRQDVLPTIYSYGHRNPQGMAVHPLTGEVWITEHGPMGGDELNLVKKGVNYGWPEVTYGLNYNGTIVSEDVARPGLEQPILYWRPSIAACGLDFYRGDLFPKWKNHLLAGALKFEEIQLLDIYEHRVMQSEVILKNAGRVRDVQTGPDGAIYVVLNNPHAVIRLAPPPVAF